MRFLLFTLLIFIAGCISEKKARNYLNNNQEFAAGYCADEFPVVGSVTYDTVIVEDEAKEELIKKLSSWSFIATDTSLPYFFDTSNVSQRSYYARKGYYLTEGQVREMLKPFKNTIIRETITKQDSARVKQLLLENESLSKNARVLLKQYADQLEKTERERKIKRLYAGIIAGILALLAIGAFLLSKFRK